MSESDLNDKQEIIQILETRILEKQISKYKLHKITGLSQSSLSRYFNGKSDMSLSALIKLSNALELKLYIIPEEYGTNEFESAFNAS
mgnify:CR=1 FL=1